MQNHSLTQVPGPSPSFPNINLPCCQSDYSLLLPFPEVVTSNILSVSFSHPSWLSTSLKSSWPAQKVTLKIPEIHTPSQSKLCNKSIKHFYLSLSTTSFRRPFTPYQSSIPVVPTGSCTSSIIAVVTCNYNCFLESHVQIVHHRTPQNSSSPRLDPFPVFPFPLKRNRNLRPQECWLFTHNQTYLQALLFISLINHEFPAFFLLPSLLSNPSCPLLRL